MQPGLLPIRYERLNGAVVSSSAYPQAPLPSQTWGRTSLPAYSSSTVYSSAKRQQHQLANPDRMYKQYRKPLPAQQNTVPPYTTVLHHDEPLVASLNSTQGHVPGQLLSLLAISAHSLIKQRAARCHA